MENEEDKDLKPQGDTPPNDSGQSGNEGGSSEGETPEELKARIAQIEKERDNYKEGLLKYKSLEKKETKPEGDDTPPSSESLTKEEVAQLVEQGISQSQESTRKVMQSKAIQNVLSGDGHKEYADDANWNRALENLNLTGSEITVEDYEARIKEAILLDKHRTGKLDEYIQSEKERSRQQGQYQERMGMGLEAGDTGTQSGGEKGGNVLTPKSEQMARYMKNDPNKVKDIDLRKDNQISVV